MLERFLASSLRTSGVPWAFSLSLALLLQAGSAHAVLQPTPGGIAVPVLNASVTDCSARNIAKCLDQSEGAPGLIKAQADALVAPEVFEPTCTLTFKPIVKGGEAPAACGCHKLKPH